MDKITYKCLCCNNWEKSIPAAWSDIKPKFCGNDKCEYSLKRGKGKKGYRTSPAMLETVLPKKPAPAPAPSQDKSNIKTGKVRKKKS